MKNLLWKTMSQPAPFGTFHLICFSIIILITVFLIVRYRKCSERSFKTIILISWIFIVMMEVLKQVLFNYDFVAGNWKSYSFNHFPYQFCSLPLYLYPVMYFLKPSKFRNVFSTYLSTFVFFGGFGYFFFPVSFCEYCFINFQTMFHHGTQVAIGIFIFVHEFDNLSYKDVLKSISLLLASIVVAILLNVIMSPFGTINLFELNPIQPTNALVFADILKATNYPIFLLVYIIGFTMFASLSYWVMDGCILLNRKLISHRNLDLEAKSN